MQLKIVPPMFPERVQLSATFQDQIDTLLSLAGRVAARAGAHTLAEVAKVMRATNSYHSNLIEDEAPAKPHLNIDFEADQHAVVQNALQRELENRLPLMTAWRTTFAPDFLRKMHRQLFSAEPGTPLRSETRTYTNKEVVVGHHNAPRAELVDRLLAERQASYAYPDGIRSMIIDSLAYHHQLAFIHPFDDGNGRVARLLTQLQLSILPLNAQFWSLARGIDHRRDHYYSALSAADELATLEPGKNTLSEMGLNTFIKFMLDVCLEQIRYVDQSLHPSNTRRAICLALSFSPVLQKLKAKSSWAPALHVLFTLGCMPRADFKSFLGEADRTASQSLAVLIEAGLVHAQSPKSRELQCAIPAWYAEVIFPGLNR